MLTLAMSSRKTPIDRRRLPCVCVCVCMTCGRVGQSTSPKLFAAPAPPSMHPVPNNRRSGPPIKRGHPKVVLLIATLKICHLLVIASSRPEGWMGTDTRISTGAGGRSHVPVGRRAGARRRRGRLIPRPADDDRPIGGAGAARLPPASAACGGSNVDMSRGCEVTHQSKDTRSSGLFAATRNPGPTPCSATRSERARSIRSIEWG